MAPDFPLFFFFEVTARRLPGSFFPVLPFSAPRLLKRGSPSLFPPIPYNPRFFCYKKFPLALVYQHHLTLHYPFKLPPPFSPTSKSLFPLLPLLPSSSPISTPPSKNPSPPNKQPPSSPHFQNPQNTHNITQIPSNKTIPPTHILIKLPSSYPPPLHQTQNDPLPSIRNTLNIFSPPDPYQNNLPIINLTLF